MTALARRVLRGLRRRGLLNDGEPVAIALSGGSDSVALAWLLGWWWFKALRRARDNAGVAIERFTANERTTAVG